MTMPAPSSHGHSIIVRDCGGRLGLTGTESLRERPRSGGSATGGGVGSATTGAEQEQEQSGSRSGGGGRARTT